MSDEMDYNYAGEGNSYGDLDYSPFTYYSFDEYTNIVPALAVANYGWDNFTNTDFASQALNYQPASSVMASAIVNTPNYDERGDVWSLSNNNFEGESIKNVSSGYDYLGTKGSNTLTSSYDGVTADQISGGEKGIFGKALDFLSDPRHDKVSSEIFGAIRLGAKGLMDSRAQDKSIKAQRDLNMANREAEIARQASQNAFAASESEKARLADDAKQKTQIAADLAKQADLQDRTSTREQKARDDQAEESRRQNEFLKEENQRNRDRDVTVAQIPRVSVNSSSSNSNDNGPTYASVPAYAPGSVLNALQFRR